MTPLQVLKEAKKKIEKEAHWTQGTAARDRAGKPTDPKSSLACRWCAIGAILSVSTGGSDERFAKEAAESLLQMGMHRLFPTSHGVPWWNDEYTRTHADVLRVYAEAIEEAKNYHWAMEDA